MQHGRGLGWGPCSQAWEQWGRRGQAALGPPDKLENSERAVEGFCSWYCCLAGFSRGPGVWPACITS